MDIVEIRNLSDEQIKTTLDSSTRELMNIRFRISTRQMDNPQELRNARKTIARLKTEMGTRGMAGA